MAPACATAAARFRQPRLPAGSLVFYNLATTPCGCAIAASCTPAARWQIYNSDTLLPATLDGNLVSAAAGWAAPERDQPAVLANAAILDNPGGGVNLARAARS